MRVMRPLLATSFLIVAGCVGTEREPHAAGPAVSDAIAVLEPTKGQSVHGVARFHQEPNGVHVIVKIDGLAANSVHAFHIHEFGDLTSSDGTNAGGHYNPSGHHHGGPDTPDHHAGDLGNLTADGKGAVNFDRLVMGLGVTSGETPIVGRSLVLHEKADDFTTQPAGNAGPRIAVGVIGVAKSAEAPKAMEAPKTPEKAPAKP